ncbi:hypothetical protein BK653_18885 [Pseudomonas brassicacearum]|nr:hypothetical protein BK653_18885 [Pseudomonas brassicacearum]
MFVSSLGRLEMEQVACRGCGTAVVARRLSVARFFARDQPHGQCGDLDWYIALKMLSQQHNSPTDAWWSKR